MENWKGTTLSFILHYQEQIRQYDSLQPPNEQTSEHAKMIYLQNAVHANEELRAVHNTASHLALANGMTTNYRDYEALLKLAATKYDRAHAPVKRPMSPWNVQIFGTPISPTLTISDSTLTLLTILYKRTCGTSKG